MRYRPDAVAVGVPDNGGPRAECMFAGVLSEGSFRSGRASSAISGRYVPCHSFGIRSLPSSLVAWLRWEVRRFVDHRFCARSLIRVPVSPTR